MNKKEQIFIINNQEDEDGYNLNPGNSIPTENLRSIPERKPPNNTADNRSGFVKSKPGGLYVSASVSGNK